MNLPEPMTDAERAAAARLNRALAHLARAAERVQASQDAGARWDTGMRDHHLREAARLERQAVREVIP